jgi:regulatory protein
MARGRIRSLRSRALSLLARREHSRAELARKLAVHADVNDNVGEILDELAAKGWLSDARFAEQVARAKARRYGPVKLAHYLKSRGVEPESITAGIRAAGADGTASLEQVWRSRFRALPQNEREKARQVRFLLGRGFRNEEIFRFLKTGNPST